MSPIDLSVLLEALERLERSPSPYARAEAERLRARYAHLLETRSAA